MGFLGMLLAVVGSCDDDFGDYSPQHRVDSATAFVSALNRRELEAIGPLIDSDAVYVSSDGNRNLADTLNELDASNSDSQYEVLGNLVTEETVTLSVRDRSDGDQQVLIFDFGGKCIFEYNELD
ncbi:hypothetical protein [Sphingosinicella sp. CPCC 101087]|uniref:hypothetical protein n=1 Tax=Sphingosinicella sp. CPCC 101087 TaxID=2497754 RepID=UPI00101CF52B|nr:hypothetical protein [Sphingosinicella sp. CPCC 101087]